MGMMMGPNGRALPVATGAALGGGGDGGRPEQLTRDSGYTALAAEPTTTPEPKEADEHPDSLMVPASEPPKPAPQAAPAAVASAPAEAYQGTGEEDIDALHARLDRLEAVVKNRVTLITVLARIDSLEAWLKARIG
jgi:hypothetical protein